MVRVDEIAILNMGQSPESSSYNEKCEGLPFFQGNADFGEVNPNIRLWCKSPTKVANSGDILISVRAPIGALNIANVQCCIGRGLAAITVNEGRCLKKYFWYAISNKVDELISKGTGSTFKAISKGVLAETEIRLPNKKEQAIIADILDKTVALIFARKRQLIELDNLVKSRFIEMFGDTETNTKQWCVMKLADLCYVGSSKRVLKSEQSNCGVPFLRVSDLVRRMETDELSADLFITEERFVAMNKHGQVPTEGDILVTSRGTLGRCYVWREKDRFYFQDGMISWLSNFSECITPTYIAFLFSMAGFRKQIDRLQAGSTVAYLSISMIRQLAVMVPDVDLQTQFAAFVSQVDKSKFEIQQSLEKLETLKKALMQQYFG